MLPTFKLQNLAATAQADVPVTFGQVFAPGDFKADCGLLGGASDGTYLPIQVDVKAKHPDGSVRHAILSMVVPAIGAKGTRTYRLLDADKRSGIVPMAQVFATVELWMDGLDYVAKLDSAAPGATWLSGPVVNERQQAVPFVAADGTKHPHLMARFSVRDYGVNQRVDVTVENAWAFEPGPQNFVYDAAVFIGSTKVYEKTALTHLVHARWRKLFWTGAAPQINVQHDAAYLISAKAVPNYDPAFPPSEAALARYAGLALNDEPMQLGAASPYFPATGGNDEIGILTAWQAAWVLSMDAHARDCTLVTANGAGSYGVHFRDQNTDRPVSLKNYPYMTVVGSYNDTWNPDTNLKEAFPAAGGDTTTPYTPDEAHQPDLAYLAYILTGDFYYLEEMQFWAMYNSFRENPNYRSAGQGLIVAGELRAQGWALRTIAHAAMLTPDDDVLKADLMALVKNNIDWYSAQYVNGPLDNNLGVPTHGYSLAYGDAQHLAVAPWMHDFFTSVFGHLIDLGFSDAKAFFNWLCKFTVGRMMSPDICSFLSVIYALPVCDTPGNGQPIVVYDTFAKAFTALYGEDVMAMPCGGAAMAASQNRSVGDLGGVSNGVMGYPSNYQPALAYAVDSGIANAQAAWNLFMARTVKPDYREGTQFSIIPVGYVNTDGPPIPDPAQNWQQIATEGQTVSVPAETIVRFGADDRWTTKVCSGAVTASNAFFGTDPAPNVAKSLEQLIQPTQGNTMTFKITIDGFDSAVQQLAPGSESALSAIRVRVMSPDGARVLGESSTLPYSLGGLDAGVYPLEIAALDSTGAVMGTPATKLEDTANAPAVTPPALPVSVSLPSAIRSSVVQES